METVDKTLNVLEVFLLQGDGVGIADLAEASGVNITTAHRIVSDLVRRGYLRQKQKRGKYSLGVKLLQFNAAIQNSLKVGDVAAPYLQQLSKLSGEYTEVAVLDDYTAVTVAQAEVDRNLKISNLIGERLPLHATSLGKVLLAHMDPVDRQAFYARGRLTSFTRGTSVNAEEIETELQTIRKRGLATDNEEYNLGVWSVAAPIYDSSQQVIASLAVAAPSARIKVSNRQNLMTLVREAAAGVSREMGARE